MHYRSLLAGVTAACAALAAGQALAQTPPAPPAAAPTRPPIETTKVEGTEGVYIFRNVNHQSMFIVTKAGVIATDPIAYGRPTGGQTYVDEIKKVTSQPIKYLIYSHHHFDHIAGGKAFKDAGARIVAHSRAKERLAVLKDPIPCCPTRRSTARRPSRSAAPRSSSAISASITPTPPSSAAAEEKIIFVVDTIPVGSFPGRGFIDIYPLETEEFIKKVIAMDWDRMIPGHPGAPGGRLGTKEDAKNVLTLMQEASADIKKLGQDGKCWEPVEKEYKMPKYAGLPGYEAGLPLVARRYCAFGDAAPESCLLPADRRI
jgi:glyoxylase-like metal-dependent hydrolase (beta-lactamase superfamily II)